MVAMFPPFNFSLGRGWKEEEQRTSEQGEGEGEGEERNEQQTCHNWAKRRQTQNSRDESNYCSSNGSATLKSPGISPLQGQGRLSYKWSPRERVYVSGRGQETAFGVVCHPPPGNSGRTL